MSAKPTRLILYLGAIDDVERPAAETLGRAEAEAQGREIAEVCWDGADQLDVDPIDRPVFGELLLDSPPNTDMMVDAGAETRDPLLHQFLEDWKRSPTCDRCGSNIVIAGMADGTVVKVCPTCEPDHPINAKMQREEPEETG